MRIVIISGHGLIGTGAPDPGAGIGADVENAWTADLADRLTMRLRAHGHEAGGIEIGSSGERTALADRVHPDLVVYLHGDVGSPAVYHYPKSERGASASLAVWGAIKDVTPWAMLRRAAEKASYPRANGLLGWGEAPAVLIELVDQRRHEDVAWLLANLDGLAEAIACGVDRVKP